MVISFSISYKFRQEHPVPFYFSPFLVHYNRAFKKILQFSLKVQFIVTERQQELTTEMCALFYVRLCSDPYDDLIHPIL